MLRIAAGTRHMWLKFAEIIGNVQLFILLSLVYWALLPLIAVPFKLLADPLALKRFPSGLWVSRLPSPQTLESMRKQEQAE